jgi:CheY-like chemotaxis protein
MADGDGGALAELYDHLAPTVLGVLVRLLSRRSLAEEVLEETFLHAWFHAEAYRPDIGSPCAWLLVIARSRGIECFRREAAGKRGDEIEARPLVMPLGAVRSRVRLGMIKLGNLSARSSTAGLPFLGHRILIVDHDSNFLEMLGLVLEQLGAKVYEVTSAAKALESLITRRPDLLISDLRMAGMDGFALLETVRALPESLGGRTPAIALSGAPASEVVSRALNSGFQIFLQKPFNENDLLLAVPTLVGRSHSQQG